jgi:hypothetical protein
MPLRANNLHQKIAFASKNRSTNSNLDQNSLASSEHIVKVIVVTPERLAIELLTHWATGLDTSLTLDEGIALRRSGKTVKLILPSSTITASKPDPKLIRLISRGFDWAMQLISGKVRTISEIAAAEGVTPTYVTRIMQFGFMAPHQIQQIVRGQQPPELTAHSIVNLGALPTDWNEQAVHLGLSNSTAHRHF